VLKDGIKCIYAKVASINLGIEVRELRMADNPICKNDGVKMHKAGFVWSGYNKRQRWQCSKCGATTIKNSEVIKCLTS
jgi:transposase-like protein